MRLTVDELVSLQRDVAGRQATIRERTAAAAFLAQFYSGIENILKRISHYCEVPLPAGETWHVALFQRFCTPAYPGLPALFDDELAVALAPYRRFRHVAFHGYGFQLEWSRLVGGVENIESTFTQLQATLSTYLVRIR
jgi:hypothetical protein